MNTAIYMLRAKQMGLSIADMDELEEGFIVDMMVESGNDNFEYKEVANQSDFDKF